MKKYFVIFCVLATTFAAMPVKAADLAAGDLIKASQVAVYYYGADGKRYVFPNDKTYFTWYSDFNSVKTITDGELAAISIGGNVTYKPGVKMVKITTDPKVYAVSGGGTLRWITTEAMAVALYGSDWSKKVEDVPDVFFTNYKVGQNITASTDFIIVNETALYGTINLEKGLSSAGQSTTSTTEKKYVWNKTTINGDSYLHNSLNFINYNSGYLALWSDGRNGQQEVYYQKTDSLAAGSDDAVRVTSNIADSKNAEAYYDGSSLYIVWDDSSLNKKAVYLQKRDIYGNKISESVFASSTYATSEYPAIAYNAISGDYGIAWWDSRYDVNTTKGDVYLSRMNGGLKTGDILRVSQEGLGNKSSPQIMSVGTKFAVLWQDDNYKIKLAIINADSTLSGSIVNVGTASKITVPRMVWSGQYFGIAWADTKSSSNDIYFAVLDENGAKISGPTAISSSVGGASEPDVLWTGSKFYVSYTGKTSQDIYLAKIALNGNISEKDINISKTSADSYFSRLAKTNSGIIAVAWLEDDGTKIFGATESSN